MTDKTQIDPITHEDERVNIPTPELAPMMDPDDARPIKAAYDLRNPDLDPQLIWRGKDIDQAAVTAAERRRSSSTATTAAGRTG